MVRCSVFCRIGWLRTRDENWQSSFQHPIFQGTFCMSLPPCVTSDSEHCFHWNAAARVWPTWLVRKKTDCPSLVCDLQIKQRQIQHFLHSAKDRVYTGFKALLILYSLLGKIRLYCDCLLFAHVLRKVSCAWKTSFFSPVMWENWTHPSR